ncbi:tryptophan-rich sensory protein [Flavobacterium silvisoli]|uniref:Tryptophan-rich sensory protein n=1 Tax=Flavobacterium silvisoli TaxID=2529433 RepID=A0A4Q9Z399_9FLAO|nr:TspO/MBR family protein [Flavobacterium silvisoli]TBX70618.1 tryptophan-rich sensory protein [Flavobacterium silvisoli]
MQKTLRIATVIMTCLAVGYFSSIVTRDNIPTWYALLNKPVFNPPNWVFAPVWTVLYVLMGYAAGRIWNLIDRDEANVKRAFIFFLVQLALNALWSFLFFGLQNPMLAFFEILLLWTMIFETYSQFKRIDKVASYLLLPYLAWVSYATVLTGSIWYLNR